MDGPFISDLDSDLDSDEAKDWIYQSFTWTPSDLLGLFHNVCREFCQAHGSYHTYVILTAQLLRPGRVSVRWSRGGAELRFHYHRDRPINSPTTSSERDDEGESETEKMVQHVVWIFRYKYGLRVQGKESIGWDSAMTGIFRRFFTMRVFGSNSERGQKKIIAQNKALARMRKSREGISMEEAYDRGWIG